MSYYGDMPMKSSGKMTAEEKKRHAEMQAECDLDLLLAAEKLKRDPGRMKAAMAMRKKKREALDAVAEGAKGISD